MKKIGVWVLCLLWIPACAGMTDDFLHTLGDAHLYSNHFDQVKLQLSRTPGALTVMKINPDVNDLFA